MSFQIGQKVVCVDDSPPKPLHKLERIMPWCEKGKVYVVSDAWEANGKNLIKVVGTWMGTSLKTHRKMGYKASRFRALEEMQANAKFQHQLTAGIEKSLKLLADNS